MPSRFYLPASGTPAVSPSIGTDWEHQNVVRRPMATTKTNTAFATTTYAPDAADHLANQDAHVVQFVGPGLAAQSIPAQTLAITVLASEAHANNNLFLTWRVYLVNAAGSPVAGGTILAIRRDATEVATTLTARTDSATTTAVTASTGDRIVLEVGLGGTPSAASGTQGHNGSLRFGDPTGGLDLAANDTATADAAPWLEFATTTLVLATPVAASDALAGGESAPLVVASVASATEAGASSEVAAGLAVAATRDDAATASEASSLAVAHARADAATVDPGLGNSTIPTTGAAAGVGAGLGEVAVLGTSVPVVASDAGSVAEAAAPAATLAASEAGAASEASALAASLPASDMALLDVEAADAPLAAIEPTDSAALAEASAVALVASDGGAGTEASAPPTAMIEAGDDVFGADVAEPVTPIATSDDASAADAAASPLVALAATDGATLAEVAAASAGEVFVAASDRAMLGTIDDSTVPTTGAGGGLIVGEVAALAQVLQLVASDGAVGGDAAALAALAVASDAASVAEAVGIPAVPLAVADAAAVAETAEVTVRLPNRPGTVGVAAIPTATVGLVALSTAALGVAAVLQEV